MNTILEHKGPHRGGVWVALGHALKEKRVKRRAKLSRKIGIDRVEGGLILGPVISRRLHADQKHRQALCLCTLQNRRQVRPRRLGRQTAQHVIAPKRDHQRIGLGRQRPVEPRQPPRRGIAGHPGVHHRHFGPLRGQPALQLRHKALIRRQAIACGQAVAQGHKRDGFGLRRQGQDRQAHEKECSRGIADQAHRRICD